MTSIIGMVRYSVTEPFTQYAWNKNYSLFEEPYFSQRLAMFKGITLKSFMEQTSQDFMLLVYHSADIPEDKKSVFKALEKGYPFLKNIFISGTKLEIPENLRQKKMMTFRIDNDDAMPMDFIARLNSIYKNNDGFYDNVVLTIPKIRKILRLAENQYQTDEINFIANSMGLAYLSTDGSTIMDCGLHTRVPYSYRTLFLEGMGGLQTIHDTNVVNALRIKPEEFADTLILDETDMLDLLATDGYAKIDLKTIPILK